MLQDNVEVARLLYDALNTGDIERILELTHPNFETVVPPEFSVEPDTYRGHEGIRRYFQSFQDVMDEIRFQPERFWVAGDSVVAATRLLAKGRHTSIPVEQRFAQVLRIREGKAVELRTYASLGDALAAVGLCE